MALPLAHIDGKYEIVTKIKEGGMGTVYKVRHRLLDEVRVIKALRPQYKDDTALRSRFMQEARAAIRLRHPNIVQIFDFHVDPEGIGFIVMEHIPGIDLGRLLAAEESLPLPLALELARQALRALGYLHRQGFVHRDFSPDNLMLTRDVEGRPLVKLIDLGIAKDLGSQSDLTATGTFLGKFRYSSPEHFGSEGPGMIEPRSDLYCFGLVLYQLATGRFPFEAESTSQLIAAHLFNEPRGFEETDSEGVVPEAMRRLLLSLLAKKPGERPESAEAVDEELAQAQAELPLDRKCLELAARLAAEEAPLPEAPTPGSTQNRLDLGFQPGRTPAPEATHDLLAAEPGPEMLAPTEVAAPTAEGTGPSERFNRHLTAALGHSDAGEFEAALRELEEASRLQPGNRTLRPLMAEARTNLEGRRRAEEAREAEEARAPAKPALTREEKVAAWIKEAGIAWEGGVLDEAARCLRKALALDPDNGWIASRLAAAEEKLAAEEVVEEGAAAGEEAGDEAAEEVPEEQLAEERPAAEQQGEEQSAGERPGEDPGASDPEQTIRLSTAELTLPPPEARAEILLRQAEHAMREDDFLKARLLAAEALEICPGHRAATELAAELDHREAAGDETDAVGRTILEIQALRLQKGPLAAWKSLKQAAEELPESTRLETLMAELAREVLEGDG